MTNFIFCLSTRCHRLNQVAPIVYIVISDAFFLLTEFYTFSMIVRHNVVAVSQCMLRDSLGLKLLKSNEQELAQSKTKPRS